MMRKMLALFLLIILAACANAPHEAAPAASPAAENVGMSGGFSPVLQIPVNDSYTKFVMAALFEPEGTGPFPAVILLSGCAGWPRAPDIGIVKRVNADYLPKGIATLVVDSFTPRGIKEVCSDPKLLNDSIAFRVKDAYAAMARLSNRPEIDSRHIFL